MNLAACGVLQLTTPDSNTIIMFGIQIFSMAYIDWDVNVIAKSVAKGYHEYLMLCLVKSRQGTSTHVVDIQISIKTRRLQAFTRATLMCHGKTT